VEFNPAADGSYMVGSKRYTGVDCGFVTGGGFRFDESAEEL
jgi:hypothetical protein